MDRTNLSIILAISTCSACALDVAQDDAPSPELVLAATTASLTAERDFCIGLQLADDGTSRPGDWVDSAPQGSESRWTDWVCDTNCYDPDSLRVYLHTASASALRQDLRVCMQASDGRRAHSNMGAVRCTPWASQGGGSSGLVTDANGQDPDSYRAQIETRAWPTNDPGRALDVRLRLRSYDEGRWGDYSAWTPWAAQGGGLTSWANDSDRYDPDGFEVEMETYLTSLDSFCSPSHPCGNGFGNCSERVCPPGTYCLDRTPATDGDANPICVPHASKPDAPSCPTCVAR